MTNIMRTAHLLAGDEYRYTASRPTEIRAIVQDSSVIDYQVVDAVKVRNELIDQLKARVEELEQSERLHHEMIAEAIVTCLAERLRERVL